MPTPKKYKLVGIVCFLLIIGGVVLFLSGLSAKGNGAPDEEWKAKLGGAILMIAVGIVVGFANRFLHWWNHR